MLRAEPPTALTLRILGDASISREALPTMLGLGVLLSVLPGSTSFSGVTLSLSVRGESCTLTLHILGDPSILRAVLPTLLTQCILGDARILPDALPNMLGLGVLFSILPGATACLEVA